MVQRILEVGDIESLDHSAIPRIRTPERAEVFSTRATRLRQLAALSNPIAGYLRLMAALADAQQAVLAGIKAKPPSAESIATAQRHSMPLIPALSGVRDPAWHDVLLQLLDELEAARPLTPSLAALVERLRTLDAATLESHADAILAQCFAEVDPATHRSSWPRCKWSGRTSPPISTSAMSRTWKPSACVPCADRIQWRVWCAWGASMTTTATCNADCARLNGIWSARNVQTAIRPALSQ